LEDGNLYLRLRKMSHTIYAANGSQPHSPAHVRMALYHRSIARLSTKRKKDVMLELLVKNPADDHCDGVTRTGTCFIQKIYAPSSSILQGKHLPFSPSPLRLNMCCLCVILSLTHLYRYAPEIFLFPTATFKYTYRAPLKTNWTRIVSERRLLKISVNETDTTTSGLRWIFHMHSEFSRPVMCNNAT
jgi:hypothetical protein